MGDSKELLEELHLKGIVSFTINTKTYEQFQKIVPSYAKSQTVEFLIKEFLNKKDSEKATILSQIHAKKTKPVKQGVL